MHRDAEATRRRLLDAARAEFARHGIAGARVDRIARASASNKAQIYHYFGSKLELFDAVFESIVESTVQETPIDAEDLPGYAARLARGYDEHPEIMRLATWQRLELPDRPALAATVDSMRHKVDAIAKAQEDGTVSSRFPADVLLGLILQLAAMWAVENPELAAVTRQLGRENRHRVVADAVRRLVEE